MPTAKPYQELHDRIAARPGAAERLTALRLDTLAEIGLYELRRALERSQTDLAAELGISQPAVSQLERGDDVKVSTLRSYVDSLGARLQILAIFDDGEAETAIPIRIGAGAWQIRQLTTRNPAHT
ncbi:MAG: XRE family transcriptional regulator [bacterium]|nr:XRE family transcriptional regulator [bacterium]